MSLMYTGRTLPCHTKNRFKLGVQISRQGNGMALRYRDYTIDRLGVMEQKAEKMLLKIINEWLCNVQLFPKVWILEISRKRFGYPGPVPVSKQFLDIRIRLQTHYPAGYPTGKPDSDHLCCVSHYHIRSAAGSTAHVHLCHTCFCVWCVSN